MNRVKILVTGATGFLGKNVCKRLLSMPVRADIYMTGGHEDTGLNIQKLDLTNFASVSDYINETRPDVVFHMGGFVDLTRTFDVAQRCININVIGTTHLLEALSNNHPKRFILASTEEVYGEGDIPYKEENTTYPPSPYAISKLAAEHMSRMYAVQCGFPAIIFRIGTMYGPHQPDHRYIHQTINKALANEDIPLNSGTKKRDYIYVDDVVDAMVKAFELKRFHGVEVINLGSGTNMTLKSLVEKIVRLTNSTSTLRIGQIPDRISEADDWLLDIVKAKKILDWEPKTDIESGLKETIEFCRRQKS